MSSSLTYINPTATVGLMQTLSSALAVVSTATANAPLYTNSDYIRGATNSLNIISAQGILATATDAQSQAQATAIIESAILDLAALSFDENLYSEWLTLWPNVVFAVVFGILLTIHVLLTLLSTYWYFGAVLLIGSGLTFAGYLSRCISVGNESDENPFLSQFITLTISPAFVMAGLYYMLGRMLVFHGDHFSILRPRWFSYIFISCDILSIVIQAIGGGVAAGALSEKQSTLTGTHTMVAGIAFQVVSMSFFIFVLAEFVIKSLFHNTNQVPFSLSNLFALLFNTKRGKELRELLEPNYVPNYLEVRQKKLFPYVTLSLFAGTAFIYIRCIYRLVELSQGWSGFLIRHQAFLMSLDALQVAFTCGLMIIFHPYFSWGTRKLVKLSDRLVNNLELEKIITRDLENGFVDDDQDQSVCGSAINVQMDNSIFNNRVESDQDKDFA